MKSYAHSALRPTGRRTRQADLKKLGVAAALLSVFASGCATLTNVPPEQRFDRAVKCLAPGAVIGGGLGAIEEGEVAVAGAVAGAAINLMICSLLDKENDADQDGVTNALDRCPDTPAGTKVDKDGCPLDSDGDGVADEADQCPNTPAGLKVDGKGCPMDNDGDGVLNAFDQCPDTPAGAKVDRTGCSEIGQPLAVLMGVNFTFDSSAILPESRFKLANAVEVMSSHPKMKVQIVGHTDSVGSDEYNKALSLRRATAVRDYLVSQGVNESRMTVDGKGESEPVAPNTTDAERMKNRRVVFTVTDK